MFDKSIMKRAIELATKGCGKVSPNPMVGAVIVKEGIIIAEGYHEVFGGNHAEVNAINNAISDVADGVMYVTLEPCSHYGKTPPCVDKIIESKISKVFIGTLDPNPLVAGKGVERLRKEGIEVEIGLLEDECKKLNEVFGKYIVNKLPFVLMKSAMTLDGKIATETGESKWISCKESRKRVHALRGKLSSIMVGVNTVIVDDPELTCRIEGMNNPIRIILDSKLRIPINSKVVNTADIIRTIVVTTNEYDKEKMKRLKEKNVEILICSSNNNRVDLRELMIKLGDMSIDSILLEGGGTLNFSALESGIVDKVQFYISPKIIGGNKAKSAIGGKGVALLKDNFVIRDIEYSTVGDDILIEGYLRGERNVYWNN